MYSIKYESRGMPAERERAIVRAREQQVGEGGRAPIPPCACGCLYLLWQLSWVWAVGQYGVIYVQCTVPHLHQVTVCGFCLSQWTFWYQWRLFAISQNSFSPARYRHFCIVMYAELVKWELQYWNFMTDFRHVTNQYIIVTFLYC